MSLRCIKLDRLGVATGAFAIALLFGWQTGRTQDSQSQDSRPQEVRTDCGPIENHYGPYDYNDPADRGERLTVVERFHFTSSVEGLSAGASGTVPADLDYTLKAFPNHARALWAMARYQLQQPWRLGDRHLSAECYFDRALRWRRSDATVWMINGLYLARRGDKAGALERYATALKLAPNDGEIHYNAALLYLDMNKLEQARPHAKRAYELGHPLPGLKNRMLKSGAWTQKDILDLKPASK
jgi:tetratricopeptide (TPR) repeat protein